MGAERKKRKNVRQGTMLLLDFSGRRESCSKSFSEEKEVETKL